MVTSTEIAKEIINQLGGQGRLKAMINARNYIVSNNGYSVSFKYSMSHLSNIVKITLNSMDTYDIIFYKNDKEVSKHEGIYNDMLKELFENETKLYLTL